MSDADETLKQDRRARLEQILREREVLDEEERAIYAASIADPGPGKVATDEVASFYASRDDVDKSSPWPIQVSGMRAMENASFLRLGRREIPWVSVRPVSDEGAGKTFLGLMIGDLATGCIAWINREDGLLVVGPSSHNPAMYVPDLRRLVFGYESWWGYLKSPDDLRQITNADIENVWYVQALKSLATLPKQ